MDDDYTCGGGNLSAREVGHQLPVSDGYAKLQ